TQPPGEPGPRLPPLARDGADRAADDACGLLQAQPRVIAKLHDLPEARLLALEALDRFVHGEQVVGRRLDQCQPLGQLDALAVPAVLDAALAAGPGGEGLAHGRGPRPRETAPAPPPRGPGRPQ